MTFTAIRGGEVAIAASHKLLARKRRGSAHVADLALDGVEGQLGLAVDRVMAEGGLHDPRLAALALKQAQGDCVEAAFLLRAFRTTLPRFGATEPIRTDDMAVTRRVATTHKDVPGGQLLGPTYDYTHRLIDFALLAEGDCPDDRPGECTPREPAPPGTMASEPMVRADTLIELDLLEAIDPGPAGVPVADLTREPQSLPAGRDQRLQNLARGDEGFLVGLAYSTMRGFGRNHPFVADLRCGVVAVELVLPEIGEAVVIGEIAVTECSTVHADLGHESRDPKLTRGYGLVFGLGERKAIAMAILDRSLRCRELGDPVLFPAQDEEFVLSHSDNVDASGLVQHLKLPHYVDFQAAVLMLRAMRTERTGEARR